MPLEEQISDATEEDGAQRKPAFGVPVTSSPHRKLPGIRVECACKLVFESSDPDDTPDILEAYQTHLPYCAATPAKTPAVPGPPKPVLAQVASAVFGNIFSFWGAAIAFFAAVVIIKIYT